MTRWRVAWWQTGFDPQVPRGPESHTADLADRLVESAEQLTTLAHQLRDHLKEDGDGQRPPRR